MIGFHETAATAAGGKSGDSQGLLCCRLGAQESASLSITEKSDTDFCLRQSRIDVINYH